MLDRYVDETAAKATKAAWYSGTIVGNICITYFKLVVPTLDCAFNF